MSTEVFSILVAGILGSSAITVFITKLFDRGKDDAAAKDILSQTWERSIRTMSEQMDRQSKRILQLEKENRDLREHVVRLETQVEMLKSQMGGRRSDDS